MNGRALLLFVVLLALSASPLMAQTTDQKQLSDQVDRLNEAMARTQAQLAKSQRQLDEMRAQLAGLRRLMKADDSHPEEPAASVAGSASSSAQTSSSALAAAVEDLRERQAMQETQIATHEQSKVESESKYPVKITGLVLLNSFVNSGAVDVAATPTVALPGAGSTGISMRQTVLGLDARGPHVLGARSYADLRVDFDGMPAAAPTAGTYTGYYNGTASLLRLRTAHAGLDWEHTDLGFSLDRPILSPDTPTSLTAVAIPALAWSGNLWTWNPQVTLTQDFDLSSTHRVELEAALIDVADALLTPVSPSSESVTTPASTAEQSRWPGLEAHVGLLRPPAVPGRTGNHIGLGGYFEPHEYAFLGRRFDSWAATLDAGRSLPGRLEFTGNFYRGQALGGLGGGAYKDIAYKADTDGSGYYSRPLDDVGGWAQIKERFSERLEMNAAFGLDNVFSDELRRYAVPGGTMSQNLARNRTYTGNVIYSPSNWLMFSLEYRHLVSSPVIGLPASSNIIGLGAGYKF